MKKLILVFLALLLATSVYAKDGIFVSYQASALMPEDDNFGYGKGFFGQGGEVGYSWRYVEFGAEYYASKLKTLFGSTFLDSSIMGTAKLKYTLPGKYLNLITPYAVAGVGAHFFTDKNMKGSPQGDLEDMPPESIHNDSSIALKWGAGVEFALTDKISIFGEAAYRYGNTGEPSSLDIYAWSYLLGGKVRF